MAFVTRRASRRILECGYGVETMEPEWWLYHRTHMWSLGLVVVEPVVDGHPVPTLAEAPITAADLTVLTRRITRIIRDRLARDRGPADIKLSA